MQYTYDDGSSIEIDGDTVSSEPIPSGWALSDYNENFTPSAVTSGAGSWEDVLKLGLGRVIDNATTRNTPQNTPVSYGAAPVGGSAHSLQQGGTFMGISTGTLLIGGLVLAGLLAVVGMTKKD